MPVAPSYIKIKTVDGLTCYAVFRAVNLTYWNTFSAALESFASGHWYSSGSNNYAVAMTKTVQSSGIAADYACIVPSMPAGVYFAEVYIQQGANPAVSDGVPAWVIEDISWNGTTLLPAINAGGNEVVDIGADQDFNNEGQSLGDADISAITSALAGQTIIVISPVGKGSLEIVSGDAYLEADGRQLDFTKPNGSNWPTDLTDWTVTLNAVATGDNPNRTGNTITLTKAGTVVTPTGASQAVRVELTDTDTADLAVGEGNRGWTFSVVATKTNDRATLVAAGTMTVLENVDPS